MSWFTKWVEPSGSSSGKHWYLELLKDPLWKAKSHKIKERDNWTCRKDFAIDRPLQVHHKGYFPGRKPWEYPDEVLVTLCDACHSSAHEFSQLPENFDLFLNPDPKMLTCTVCELLMTASQESGRFDKGEPICESCCLIMEEGREFV